MKNIFKGYYPIAGSTHSNMWHNSLVVFDTSALLNLYRYREHTSLNVLLLMERLGDRLWAPYHVMLEFQRNRSSVINEHISQYSNVQGIVSASITEMRKNLDKLDLANRHTFIDPDDLLASVEQAKKDFFEHLKNLKDQTIQSPSEDRIRDKLDILFENKVGSPPKEQSEIDDIEKEGQRRYEQKIPPGYEDDGKEGCFSYGGITYQKKFGDLFIWKQIITHAKSANIENLILVIDDNKSDWWWIHGKSDQIDGRPELIDEIGRLAEVVNFKMHNTESCLLYTSPSPRD